MKSFLIKTTILFVVFILIGYVVYGRILSDLYIPILPIALIIIYFLTNVVHYYLVKIAGKNIKKFINTFMALNFSKMFVYLIFAVSYSFFHKEQAKVFLINFLVFYIAFTFLEIYEINRVVKMRNE